MILRTRDGDVLDRLCRDHYGPSAYDVEAVYAANPGLAAHGPVLPAGLIITLPEHAAFTPHRATIRLWD